MSSVYAGSSYIRSRMLDWERSFDCNYKKSRDLVNCRDLNKIFVLSLSPPVCEIL